jgi:hypothetical protein
LTDIIGTDDPAKPDTLYVMDIDAAFCKNGAAVTDPALLDSNRPDIWDAPRIEMFV